MCVHVCVCQCVNRARAIPAHTIAANFQMSRSAPAESKSFAGRIIAPEITPIVITSIVVGVLRKNVVFGWQSKHTFTHDNQHAHRTIAEHTRTHERRYCQRAVEKCSLPLRVCVPSTLRLECVCVYDGHDMT